MFAELPTPVVEAITAACITTFEELTQTVVIPGNPYLTRTNPPAEWVTAEIALRRALPGKLIVSFPRPALEQLVVRYLPADVPLTTEITDDMAGELANVIAGQTKTMLHGTRYHFTLSTPRIGPLATNSANVPELLAFPFKCDVGEFAVYVSLAPCDEQPFCQ